MVSAGIEHCGLRVRLTLGLHFPESRLFRKKFPLYKLEILQLLLKGGDIIPHIDESNIRNSQIIITQDIQNHYIKESMKNIDIRYKRLLKYNKFMNSCKGNEICNKNNDVQINKKYLELMLYNEDANKQITNYCNYIQEYNIKKKTTEIDKNNKIEHKLIII